MSEAGEIKGEGVERQFSLGSDANPDDVVAREVIGGEDEQVKSGPVRIDDILPTLDELPIPDIVVVGKGWTEQMREMADHIGPRATLLIVDALGGQRLSIGRKSTGPFAKLIGVEAAAKLAHIYGGFRFQVPAAKAAVQIARRGAVLSAARKRLITVGDAARILKTTRSYATHLVNETTEGWNVPPIDLGSLRGEVALKRTLSKLVHQLCAAGVASSTITAIWTSVFVALGSIENVPSADRSNAILLRRAADAVVAELSSFDIDPDAVDAACGAVLSLLDMEATDAA